MKIPKAIEFFFGAILILESLAEILALPIFFVVLGIWNDFGYPYYLIIIGGYFLLFGLSQLAINLIFRMVDKAYEPRYKRKLKAICDKFSAEGKGCSSGKNA